MENISLRISNSHYIIVTAEGLNLLVDTGSPVSFCEGNKRSVILFSGIEYSVQPKIDVMEQINNSGLIHEKIDALIGMDILCHHSFEFDRVENVVKIDAPLAGECYAYTIPMEVFNIMGQQGIALNVEINNQSVKTILDTGAWISYLSSSCLQGIAPVGRVEDFNPIFGKINATKHIVEMGIGGSSQNLAVAKMPNMLEMMMKMLGIDLVLGLDAIECDKICLDFLNGKLFFS